MPPHKITACRTMRIRPAVSPAGQPRGNISTRPQIMCPAIMWICWISGVKSDGACRQKSQRDDISPPVLPVKPTVVIRSAEPRRSPAKY
jgi:hypothetical protein